MRKIGYYIFAFIIVVTALSVSAKSNDNDDCEMRQRKAQYVFMEAMRQKAVGKFDSYHELLRYAYDLDSCNTALSYQLGYSMLMKKHGTEENLMRAMSFMKKHVDSVPEDYNESVLYGNLCAKLRMTDESLGVWEKLAEIYPRNENVLYNLADAYAGNREFDKAIAICDTLEVYNGKSGSVSVRKMNYHLAQGDTVGTIEEGRRLLVSSPRNADYTILLGNVFAQFNETDSAMLYYERAHEMEPDNGIVYLYKAELYRMQGDSVNYDKQIYNALINKNLAVEQKLEVLTDYVRDELRDNMAQSERIDNLFRVLIEQHPHEPAIHNNYSQYFTVVKDYKSAAEQLGYVLDLEPTASEEWKHLVLLNLMAEDYEAVLKTADKAFEYNPDDIDLYQYIAPAYTQIKEYDKAVETYNLALEKSDSTNMELRSTIVTRMGDAYFVKGDTIKAFECYEKAIDYNPGNIMAMNNYAYFLAESGKDLDKAERLSAQTIRYEPENPTYLDTYAWIFFKKGEYALALTYMKSAIEHSTEEDMSAELFEHYGDILFMNGKHEEAVPNWEKALELKPDSEILQRKVKHKTFFFK